MVSNQWYKATVYGPAGTTGMMENWQSAAPQANTTQLQCFMQEFYARSLAIHTASTSSHRSLPLTAKASGQRYSISMKL